MTTSTTSTSPFHIPLDLSRTALLLTDIQTDILCRFPPAVQEPYLQDIHTLLTLFREEITRRRTTTTTNPTTPRNSNTAIPLIIHHILPHGLNSNAFISPYNKLSTWAQRVLPPPSPAHKDPTHPIYPVSSFGSSDLWAYLRAREVRHVVLVGLTAVGAVLGSARHGADLDLHVVVVREGVLEEEAEVGAFVVERVLGRFVDVVDLREVVEVFGGE
ncbi:Isochorismatase hydrolase [Aspergillus japonicus CBS 114.51]|uniref:Isochorismatase hydrolase n=1 Tax=Aspergillus japonicus CBS 114.51 TaxID=1448312 RepID=A0A8T8X8T8_ASPJA|nr:Isochorismatase hydrolase [Aspergillus japonicus CBS 114.51]RAH84548.1 Isochorismatase hydrolase [Aspergillus japonicus CBS 114.51]